METTHKVQIGVWIEAEDDDRIIHSSPTYYAADWEKLEVVPGEYPLYVSFASGFTVPVPDRVSADIQTNRLAGEIFSGFGGVNFASRKLPLEPVTFYKSMEVYQLAESIADGRARLFPGFEWLLEKRPWQAEGAPKTWSAVRALCGDAVGAKS